MLLLNMVALLTYSLIEKEIRSRGLHITTRSIIQKLENLTIVRSSFEGGITLYKMVSVDKEQELLLEYLSQILNEFGSKFEQSLKFNDKKQLFLALPPPDKIALIA